MDDLHVASVGEKEVVQARAQWRDPRMEDTRSAGDASPQGGADAVTSAWMVDQRSQSLGQELPPEEEWRHVVRVCASQTAT